MPELDIMYGYEESKDTFHSNTKKNSTYVFKFYIEIDLTKIDLSVGIHNCF